MPPVAIMPRMPPDAKANPDQMSAPPSPVLKSSWETPIPISVPPRRIAPIVLRSPIRARRTRRSISSSVYPSTVCGTLGTASTPTGSSVSPSAGSSAAGSEKTTSSCALTLWGKASTNAQTHRNPNKQRIITPPFAPARLRQVAQSNLGSPGSVWLYVNLY